MIGQTLGHYQILDKLGEGGMSTVYLAEDQKLHRKVALKFLHPRLTASSTARERLLREARAAAALNHPNVVAVHDIGEHDDQVFIVMDYLQGRTLAERMQEAQEAGGAQVQPVAGDLTPTSMPTESIEVMEVPPAAEPSEAGPLADEELIDIALQISRGLAAAHKLGIVHRDIKPQNILIDEEGQVRIVDFGLAKLKGAQPLTAELTTMGTVNYMSPEQAEGGEVDHRTDLWSLGVVLYQMMTGNLPFRGETPDTVIHSILHREPPPLPMPERGVKRDLHRVVSTALKKDPAARFADAEFMEQALLRARTELAPPPPARSIVRLLTRPRVAIPILVVLGLVGLLAGRSIRQQSSVEWAHETAIPEILQLIEQDDLVGAFEVARQAEPIIPASPVLAGLWDQMSNTVEFRTDPPGAAVSYREYDDTSGSWTFLERTPNEQVRLPVGIFRVRIEAAGFETREVVRRVNLPARVAMWKETGWYREEDPSWRFDFALDPVGSLPEGMIAVDGGTYTRMPIGEFPFDQTVTLARYLIDRTEVTNRQFREFVEAGGYERRDLWRHPFVRDGVEISFEEAMQIFRDSTDRPGPAQWVMGEAPSGLEDHPVEGVSWYEAAAYCEFRGKSLPTVYHWGLAAFPTWEQNQPIHPLMIPLSNFESNGTVPAGSTAAIGVSGALDMAGNVREWCLNASGEDRFSLGAAWSDAGKITTSDHTQSPWNRIPTNGLRCVKYLEGEPDEQLTAAVDRAPYIELEAVPGRSDDEWRTVADRYYRYFPAPLNASVDATGDSPTGGREEWVTVDAPYGDERLPIRLHLPASGSPPFQAVIYFPGSDLNYLKSVRDWDVVLAEVLDFIVKSGRVLVQPVFEDTLERSDPNRQENPDESQVTWGHWVMEVSRTLDYLEERDDIDGTKVAYAGFSMGTVIARDVLAVDDRFQAALLWMGGFWRSTDMDYMIDQLDCARRVTTPTLMLNGRYDLAFDLETQQVPMFEAFGTPEEHKRHVLFDLGHTMSFPRAEFIRENLAWLDTYLGPVEKTVQ